MDATLETLTALLLDPFLTFDEARKQADATPRHAPVPATGPVARRSPRRVEVAEIPAIGLEF